MKKTSKKNVAGPKGQKTGRTPVKGLLVGVLIILYAIISLLVVKATWWDTTTARKPADQATKTVAITPSLPEPPDTGFAADSYVTIIIDDLGVSYNAANQLMDIGLDLTLSIMPEKKYSKRIAVSAMDRGFDVMLHMPMEPRDYPTNNPGKGALLVNLSDDEITRRMNTAIDSVPGIIGVNNHMGSRFSENCEKMATVMGVIKERKLFFLDSRTSKDTCAQKTAKEFGVPNGRRNVFLDNDRDKDSILKQLRALIKRAKKNGYAVAICHPYPETIAALKELREILQENNVGIKKISEMISYTP